MDKVILIQFEAYLRARGIKPETNATKVTNGSKGKRRKRSTEKRISETLPAEKVCSWHLSIKIVRLLIFNLIQCHCNLVTYFFSSWRTLMTLSTQRIRELWKVRLKWSKWWPPQRLNQMLLLLVSCHHFQENSVNYSSKSKVHNVAYLVYFIT